MRNAQADENPFVSKLLSAKYCAACMEKKYRQRLLYLVIKPMYASLHC